MSRLTAYALTALLCAALGGGCKSKAPPRPAEEPPRPATEWTPLEAALARLEVRLPHVVGSPTTPPVDPDGRWTTRALQVSTAGVFVDGELAQELQCPDGAASCEAPEGGRAGWAPAVEALGGRPPALLAVDRGISVRLAGSLLAALRPAAGVTWLVQGAVPGTVRLDPGPGLAPSLLDASLSAAPIPRGELRSRLGATGVLPDAEPPRAPGRLVRVTTGALVVPDACGGLDAARVIRGRISALRGCYREALQRTPTAAGTLDLSFRIAGDGHVTAAAADANTTGDAAIAACATDALGAVKVPPHESEPCQVTWRLTMRPEEDSQATPASPAVLALPLLRGGVVLQGKGEVSVDAPSLTDALRLAAAGRTRAVITADGALPVEEALLLAAAAHAAGLTEVELEVSP